MQYQQPYPPTPPRPRKRNAGKVIGIGIAALLGLLLFASCVAVLASPDKPASSSPATTSADPAPTASESTYTPKPADFELRVKILKKECFGTAGCNVTYRITLSYDGPALDPDTTYEVTYKVRGPEDGPTINTLTVTGDEYKTDSEELASTPSAGTKLTARVTEISEE